MGAREDWREISRQAKDEWRKLSRQARREWREQVRQHHDEVREHVRRHLSERRQERLRGSGAPAPAPAPHVDAARQAVQAAAPVVGQVGRAVVDGLRGKMAAWQDPRARALRKRRRARRALRFRGWTAGITGGATTAVALAQAPETLVIGGGGVTALFAALAVSAGLRSRRLHRTPLPEAAAPPPEMPPPGSLAREPMERLAGAERSLAELLRQLTVPGAHGVAAVPSESVEDTRTSAAEAAGALRGVAARLRAVELARDAAPASERASLAEDATRLRAQLDEGVDDYGRLVAAAGRAVAASAASGPREALADATDRLAGLAAALRELGRGTV
ncbi:hypothetical protein LX15_000626 [Streptoalloteichus tenebrarius]|uniref:Uncharacterized protein n=1 Tax=Streptoalloteichus tenebrarius (strain ATCC 17920 / DSM 40477 / JCM 4838 / CBS 697.72 / NBRC 16177 / NCIMB 11028 / NRRL B-12390 / A12253. 1 / ISP 5477) TaxID=1933 RepID=A0ABT1HN60_STRSD|nr:hypothetical protein [Streptoalloteichus tenebrarius]MCP2256943.1 hypothetical protein [Streptoalloteichus tenebrarius]BFF00145.1 hypothetical protein GCM10020241_18200 [Streptoalloteichus tenebrarius]